MLVFYRTSCFWFHCAAYREDTVGAELRVRYQGQRHLTVPATLKHTHTRTDGGERGQ